MDVAIIVGIISLFGVILSAVITLYVGQKNIKANIIARSRIDWIQSVREYLSCYLSVMESSILGFNCFMNSKHSNEDKEKWLKEEFADKLIDLDKYRNLLVLHFGDNEENNKFIECIDDVFAAFNNEIKGDNPEYSFPLTYKKTDILVDYARNYLKREWEKAKNNK